MVRGDAEVAKNAIDGSHTHIIKKVCYETEVMVNKGEPGIVRDVAESVGILVEGYEPSLRPETS